jgi:hypothetical protein
MTLSSSQLSGGECASMGDVVLEEKLITLALGVCYLRGGGHELSSPAG